jgi:hypothetical protein
MIASDINADEDAKAAKVNGRIRNAKPVRSYVEGFRNSKEFRMIELSE